MGLLLSTKFNSLLHITSCHKTPRFEMHSIKFRWLQDRRDFILLQSITVVCWTNIRQALYSGRFTAEHFFLFLCFLA